MDKRDENFRELMKSYQPPKAPIDFRKKVMEEINMPEASRMVYKPVFGKWLIRFMFGGFLAFIIYAVAGESVEPSQNPKLIGTLMQKLPKTEFEGFNLLGIQIRELIDGVPSVVVFTLIAATLLLLLDAFILKRFRHPLAS